MTIRSRVGLLCLLAACVAAQPTGLATQEQRGGQPSLVALFNTAGNLGFATIRASFAPADQPLPQAAIDWTVIDYTNVQKWVGVGASCFTFDLSRVENAASIARSTRPAARQMWQLADQLHRDYRTAVQRSTCTLGLGSSADLQTFYDASLAMGFATARASYFYYSETPTPREVANQILGDLSTVRSGLQVLQKCINVPASDNQIQAALRRLGTVPGKDSYTDMTAIYIAIETALKGSTCSARQTDAAPSPGALTGERGASCMQSRCAAPCKGAVMMLGVLSAGPECQACMAQNCK